MAARSGGTVTLRDGLQGHGLRAELALRIADADL
jgi:hypothetical protein